MQFEPAPKPFRVKATEIAKGIGTIVLLFCGLILAMWILIGAIIGPILIWQAYLWDWEWKCVMSDNCEVVVEDGP